MNKSLHFKFLPVILMGIMENNLAAAGLGNDAAYFLSYGSGGGSDNNANDQAWLNAAGNQALLDQLITSNLFNNLNDTATVYTSGTTNISAYQKMVDLLTSAGINAATVSTIASYINTSTPETSTQRATRIQMANVIKNKTLSANVTDGAPDNALTSALTNLSGIVTPTDVNSYASLDLSVPESATQRAQYIANRIIVNGYNSAHASSIISSSAVPETDFANYALVLGLTGSVSSITNLETQATNALTGGLSASTLTLTLDSVVMRYFLK